MPLYDANLARRPGRIMHWVLLGGFIGVILGIALLIVQLGDRRPATKEPRRAALRLRGVVKLINVERGRFAFVVDESKRQESFQLTAETQMVGFPEETQEWKEKVGSIALGQRIEVVYAPDEDAALEVRLLDAP